MASEISWSANLTYYDLNQKILELNGGSRSLLSRSLLSSFLLGNNRVCKSIHKEFYKYDLPRMILTIIATVGILGGSIGVVVCLKVYGPYNATVTANLLAGIFATALGIGLFSFANYMAFDVANLQMKKLKSTQVSREMFQKIMDQEIQR